MKPYPDIIFIFVLENRSQESAIVKSLSFYKMRPHEKFAIFAIFGSVAKLGRQVSSVESNHIVRSILTDGKILQ